MFYVCQILHHNILPFLNDPIILLMVYVVGMGFFDEWEWEDQQEFGMIGGFPKSLVLHYCLLQQI